MIRSAHPMRTLALIYLAAIVGLMLQGGCGASAREKALSTTLLSVNAARDGFIEWDWRHQEQLVDGATSLEDGRAKLSAYREKREPVVLSFEVTYRLLALAAIDKETSLDDVLVRASELVKAIAALKKSVD